MVFILKWGKEEKNRNWIMLFYYSMHKKREREKKFIDLVDDNRLALWIFFYIQNSKNLTYDQLWYYNESQVWYVLFDNQESGVVWIFSHTLWIDKTQFIDRLQTTRNGNWTVLFDSERRKKIYILFLSSKLKKLLTRDEPLKVNYLSTKTYHQFGWLL